MKDGGQAFPVRQEWYEGQWSSGSLSFGMSLRDYFAAAALQGWMATYDKDQSVVGHGYAALAYRVADAMLAERDK